MKHCQKSTANKKGQDPRPGSTLIIVIALLGLLAFTGMVFFSFANSERASAEYFSEAAKAGVDEPTNVWDHMLRHIIVGPSDRPSDRPSILRSPTGRHSIVRNMVGSDLAPYSGTAINVTYNAGLPQIPAPAPADWLDFVDSPAARNGSENRAIAPPAPDVDFTSPDINSLFLAYKGWAIRDNSEDRNSNGTLDLGEDRDNDGMLDVPNPRYERIPVTIPSFFRPQYMKSKLNAGPNDASGNPLDIPTDPFWAYSWNPGANPGNPDVPGAPTVANRTKALFGTRSMRPHPMHIAGFQADGITPVFRYLTDAEATSLAPPLASGGFPFLPENDTNALNDSNIRGEMGIWTGSNHSIYELDADNDGDNTNGREGIWLDLHYPLQEKVDAASNTRLYVVLHSVTIYDLDALVDLNIHGNLSGLTGTAASGKVKTNSELGNAFVSRSNLGLGPNEVNPEWSLRRDTRTSNVAYSTQVPNADTKDVLNQFVQHIGSPASDVEQANAELLWLLTGRGQFDGTKLENVLPGRWGEAQRTLNALKQGYDNASYFPRAGRSEFDDNGDELEGEIASALARIRPFGRPMDYAGTGFFSQARIGFYEAAYGDSYFPVGDSITDPNPFPVSPYYDYGFTNNPRVPWMYQQSSPVGPCRWPRYEGYSRIATLSAVPNRFVYGIDGVDAGSAMNPNTSRGSDDLNAVPNINSLLDDPLEIVNDQDLERKDLDSIFGSQDTIPLHIDESDTVANSAIDKLDPRLRKLAPYAFAKDSDIRERFTTVTNSLRRFMMRYDPSGPRAFEFSADSDGADTTGDGIPDGDGLPEFPPRFYTDVNTDGDFDLGTDTPIQAYSAMDPFRPQVRRVLTMEPGESKSLIGQLPLSINHVLDVVRNQDTPAESSKDFRTYMQRTGLRFRSLTDHPDALESDGTDTANQMTGVYTLETSSDADSNTVASEAAVSFPPKTLKAREFWARRDRQKLARDIYVLLYLTGGANVTGATKFRDYSGTNLPSLPEGDANVHALYTHEQLRRMAQFAVNMVDAMDTDDIITKFEYDKNLGNGWELDDDPYSTESAAIAGDDPASAPQFALFNKVTGNGSHREDSETRGVVYGVEAQQLGFSEVLAFSTAAVAPDHALTFHTDSAIKYHLFLELQNLLPTSVPISTTQSTTAAKSIWRIVRYNREVDTEAIGGKGNGGNPNWSMHILAQGGNPESLPADKNYTIGTTSSNDVVTSSFFVNFDADPEFELIAPDTANTNLPTLSTSKTDSAAIELKPRCDLDVIHPDHASKVEIRNSAGIPVANTDFLSDIKNYLGNGPAGSGNLLADVIPARFSNTTGEGFELVLQRRANPNLPTVASSSGQTVDVNPWIDVDRISVAIKEFPLALADTATELASDGDLLQGLISLERREALDAASQIDYSPSVTPEPDLRYNTLGSIKNSATPASGFAMWQDHSDRDFASSMDLLSIPVVGPGFLTQRIGDFNKSPYAQSRALAVIRTTLPANASAMFLRPDFPDDGSTSQINQARDNRWFRLFQFVEVPSRVHRMLGDYLALTKIPGKLNINTMRHWEVYAGLIDNPMFLDRPDGGTSSNITIDRSPGNTGASVDRDRWLEMLLTRDGAVSGRDTGTSNRSLFYLPGVPGAKPFRSIGTYGATALPTDSGILDTILRPFADDQTDGDLATDRHWLEVSDTVQHKTPQANTSTHHQHQILSKVVGNTTTVSNTFVVHATAAYFEAFEDPVTGLVRVGGRFDFDENGDPKNDQQRAMFIIDRTSAFDAYDPGTGDFNWERLVKARVTIQE